MFIEFKTVFKLLHRLITLTIVTSAILTGWSIFTLRSKPHLSKEINTILHEMYSNQISFLSNMKDLSILLIKDTFNSIPSENEKKISSREKTNNSGNIKKRDDNKNEPIRIVVKPLN